MIVDSCNSLDKKYGAPECGCLKTITSDLIDWIVKAVLYRDSPFFELLLELTILITSAPRIFPACSNDDLVLVLGSKNKVIIVFPFNSSVFLKSLFRIFVISSASSRIAST